MRPILSEVPPRGESRMTINFIACDQLSFGKGEVVSSLLTGSTRKAQQITASLHEHSLLPRDCHVNKACFPQLNWGKTRGICSASVRVCKSKGPFPKLSKPGARHG